MGSMNLDLGGWLKKSDNDPPQPVDHVQFFIDEGFHVQLEKVEEELQRSGKPETFLDVDPEALGLRTSPECGPLSDCQMRVYLDTNERGHFHLVGHRASDHSLVYTNAVMVDILL